MKHNTFESLQHGAKNFIKNMKGKKPHTFRYSYGCPETMVASALAASISGLLDILPDRNQQKAWAIYLNSFQQEDGWFFDKEIDEVTYPDAIYRWGRMCHRTRHSLWALSALNASSRYRLTFLDSFRDASVFQNFLHTIQKKASNSFWGAGNWLMDLGILLTWEYSSSQEEIFAKRMSDLFDWLDSLQDPTTGFWWKNPTDLREAMAGAMHLYPLYWAWHRPLHYEKEIAQSTLALQQSDGLFDYKIGIGGGQCLDFDAVNILSNLYWKGFFQEEILLAMRKVEKAILINRNSDGGFSYQRTEDKFTFGTPATSFISHTSAMWESYARLLTIGMTSAIIPDSPFSGPWKFDHNIFELRNGGKGWKQGRYCTFPSEEE
ncbi:MAG: hypothetical protein WDA18_04480 [Candidatus Ratteibacteria bacterium]|jgi:hypothetical protein